MFNLEVNSWFRALARFCDYCLFFLTLCATTLFLPFFYSPLFYYFLALATLFLWAPLEALLISKWGTTPGKALLGLSVRDAFGVKLSFLSALRWAFFLPGRPGTLLQKKVSWARKLCAIAAGGSFVMTAIYGNYLALWSVGLNQGISPQEWVQYSPNYGGFKVSFPTVPEENYKELVIPDSGKVLPYEELTSSEKNDKVLYSVSHMQLPRKWRLAGDTTLLKGVLDVLVTHTDGGELIEKEFKKFSGHRVLDYRMKQGKEEVKGRLIIVGATLFKLSINYPPSHAEEMQQNPFLDSFETS